MVFQFALQRDQCLGQSGRGDGMIAVNAFDLLGKRYQEGQFAAMGLMIPRQKVIDERSGFLRRFEAGRPPECFQFGKQIRRRQAGPFGRIAQRDVARTAEIDGGAAKQLRSTRQFGGNGGHGRLKRKRLHG